MLFPVNTLGKLFYVQKSNRKNKKYDVSDANHQYITSFGDRRYQQYFDAFGQYSYLNHGDEYRRNNYRKRAKGIGHLNDPNSANFWSFNFLW